MLGEIPREHTIRGSIKTTKLTNYRTRQEQSEGVIKLLEDDPDNVKRMIDYMYTLEYDVEGAIQSPRSDASDEPIKNSAITHAQMYAMGDKYLIPTLKDYSAQS